MSKYYCHVFSFSSPPKMKNSETSSKQITSTIAQIIIVLSGPSGIDPKVQDTLANIFEAAHYNVVKVAMPFLLH